MAVPSSVNPMVSKTIRSDSPASLLPVGLELGVVHQLIVGSNHVAELLLRSRDLGLERPRQQREDEDGEDGECEIGARRA